jgi:isoquinoline 1-oxidoreductase beta subunit
MRRRHFILGGLGAGAVLVVGWGLLPPRGRLGDRSMLATADGAIALNGWIEISPDGAVILAMNRSEMGQGVHTALAMIAAEELDAPLASVRLVPAGPQKIYGNVAAFVASLPLHPREGEPERETLSFKTGRWFVAKLARELGINLTGGSSSVVDAWDALRLAAATARAQLLGAAALRWKLPVDELSIDAGVVSHASGPRAHFGELAAAAAATPVSAVAVKGRHDWRLVGTPQSGSMSRPRATVRRASASMRGRTGCCTRRCA